MLVRTMIWLYGVFWLLSLVTDPTTQLPLMH